MNVKTFIVLLVCLLSMTAQSSILPDEVQDALPAGAAIIGEQSSDELFTVLLQLESGEELALSWCAQSGSPHALVTETAAPSSSIRTIERDAAESLLLQAYPDAIVLFSREEDNALRTLGVISSGLCGEITFDEEHIVSRRLEFGNFMEDGRLTAGGARAALALHRPEAHIAELELDEDDGLLLYEGEAILGKTEYEFEIHARNGKLLEWERD